MKIRTKILICTLQIVQYIDVLHFIYFIFELTTVVYRSTLSIHRVCAANNIKRMVRLLQKSLNRLFIHSIFVKAVIGGVRAQVGDWNRGEAGETGYSGVGQNVMEPSFLLL